MFNFLPKIASHIGLGDFVSDSIQFSFSLNENILHQLHRIEFK
jgi:hypothetical protein